MPVLAEVCMIQYPWPALSGEPHQPLLHAFMSIRTGCWGAQVASLERIERELIERLRRTQLEQQAAYSELEHALGEAGPESAPSVTRTGKSA